MTQAVDLTINDGTSTPVARAFSLFSGQNGDKTPAVWNYKGSLGYPIGWTQLSVLVRRTATGVFRQEISIKKPLVDSSVVSAPKLLGKCMVDVTIVSPPSASDVDRAHALAYAINFLSTQRDQLLSLTPYY